jgi:predicted GIY-YIG superfamily endonuclease
MTDVSRPDDAGTVYLLHLDPAYKHARHYVGWTSNLDARLEAHRAGRGARLLEAVKEAGGSFRLVRTWAGSRSLERAIKDRKEAPKLCPDCSPSPKPVARGRSAPDAARRAPAAEPAADVVPEPGPEAGLRNPWPGRAAGRDLYEELLPVTDRLISRWSAQAGMSGPELLPSAELELEALPAGPAHSSRPARPSTRRNSPWAFGTAARKPRLIPLPQAGGSTTSPSPGS